MTESKEKKCKMWVVEQMAFVKVAEASEIPSGKMKMVKFEEKEILIANVNGAYYAIANGCTHAGGDLSKETLNGTTVTCLKHGAKFDITSGKVVSQPKVLFMYRARYAIRRSAYMFYIALVHDRFPSLADLHHSKVSLFTATF
jgi:nitrite reductase/ring-hydroxylating ferredoxin subunit